MSQHGRMTLLVVAGSLNALVTVPACQAGTKVYVGRRCQEADRKSIDEVDHSRWDGLLKEYVDEDGLVDYAAWKRSDADQAALDAYLADVGCVDLGKPSSRDARLAYWINIYNALTIKGILREYPTSSIRNHTPVLFGYHIWKDLQVWVGGRYYSLEQIEHEVLRKMAEPRIHFAIVCASIGCPKLRGRAYTAKRLQEQLDRNADDFFSRHDKFRADVRGRTLYLSPILSWFGDDFGDTQAEQLRAIAQYLPSEPARQLARQGGVRVEYLEYDWSLNDQKGRRRPKSQAARRR